MICVSRSKVGQTGRLKSALRLDLIPICWFPDAGSYTVPIFILIINNNENRKVEGREMCRTGAMVCSFSEALENRKHQEAVLWRKAALTLTVDELRQMHELEKRNPTWFEDRHAKNSGS